MDATAENSTESQGKVYAFGAASFAVTWFVSLWRISPTANWSGDLATVQGLSGMAVGSELLISGALGRLARFVPIGTLVQRLGMVSALGAACCAWFAFLLIHHALSRSTAPAWARCSLALGASLVAHLGTAAQLAATRPGGATIAAAAVLVAIWLCARFDEGLSSGAHSSAPQARQRAATLGLVLAVAWMESHIAGLLGLLVALATLARHRRRFDRVTWLYLVGGLLVPLFVIALPWHLGRTNLIAVTVEPATASSLMDLRPFTGLGARLLRWSTLQGWHWVALGVAGITWSLVKRRHRSSWMLVTLVGAFLLDPGAQVVDTYQRHLTTLAGSVPLMAAASVGLAEIVHFAAWRRSSAEALAIALALVAETVTILVKSEEAAFATNHYGNLGAEAWTDEALTVLPARAIVLARTDLIVRRLVAARYAEATRPDVLVVPVERSTEPRVVSSLLTLEPQLSGLLRDLAINGRPSENSVSGLADVRPLYVEFDRNWGPRLREHLLVQPFFHRVVSQTLGRSDRSAVLSSGQRAVKRLIGVVRDGSGKRLGAADPFTLAVVEGRLREQLTLLLALGDRAGFDSIAADYESLFARSAWMTLLRKRIATNARGAVDAFDLLETPLDLRPSEFATPGGAS